MLDELSDDFKKVAILCEYDYIKRMVSSLVLSGSFSKGRNTLRVRLYQKFDAEKANDFFSLLHRSQYSASTIISKVPKVCSGDWCGEYKVAILCEYDYIKRKTVGGAGEKVERSRNTLRVRLYQKYKVIRFRYGDT